MTEPVADAARGILDGHLILSRGLAQRGHYPAIDILDSVSRVADEVTDAAHRAARRQLIGLLAAYKQVEDLVQIGAYAKGSNPEADVALAYEPALRDLLRQDLGEALGMGGAAAAFTEWRSRMVKTAIEAGAELQRATARRGAPAPAAQRRG
jgi:flagellar biosynthesis/type III secretory pathway ATPase